MEQMTRRQIRHVVNWGKPREKRLALQLLDTMMYLKLAREFNLEYENGKAEPKKARSRMQAAM